MLTPTLRRDDGWLLHEGLVPEGRAFELEQLLVWSGELSGGCKFARRSARAALRVQTEYPALAESEELSARVQHGFSEAASKLGLGASSLPDRPELPVRGPMDLASLCREAGWDFDSRSDASLSVDLGVVGAYVPALIEARADGIAIEAELVRLSETNSVCRKALAALLLRVNASFRMVRAVLRDQEPRALLEIRLSPASGAAELGEAISALAIAARRSTLEARAVATDARIARAVLDMSTVLDMSGKCPLV